MKLIDKDKLKVAILRRIYPIIGENGESSVGMSANDIMEIIHAQPAAMEWHKITRREPKMDEQVLVTDGETVWIDVFEEWNGYVFLDIGNIDEVIAWMECPSPYKESTTECITDKQLGYSEIGLSMDLWEV